MLLADSGIDGFHVTENRKGDQTPSRIKVRIDSMENMILLIELPTGLWAKRGVFPSIFQFYISTLNQSR